MGKLKKGYLLLYFKYIPFRNDSFFPIPSVKIYFVNFRLGDEFARIYEDFEVNTSKIKSSQRVEITLETKRVQGVTCSEEIAQSCTEILNSISNVLKWEDSHKMETICQLRNHLVFVRKRLMKFANITGTLGSNTFEESIYYSPSILEMRQNECGDLLYDIFSVASNLKHFFRSTYDVRDMNIGLRLVYTFSKFLIRVVQCNTKVRLLRHRSRAQYVWIGYRKRDCMQTE